MRIGVDLGGHTITVARVLLQEGQRPLIDEAAEIRTPPERGVADVMDAIASLAAALSAGHEAEGVGLTVPGALDAYRRYTKRMSNFPKEWDCLDIPNALSRAMAGKGLSLPVKIENDANCYALGEGAAGEAVGLSDYVVFTMGTGIGCGIVVGGRLITGAHGLAAEGGHIVVSGNAPCGCGGIGHSETLAAADGTRKRAEALGLPGDFRDLWAMRGDPAAKRVLDVTLDGMARTVATVCQLLDPEAVIIGGGMSRAEGIADAIKEAAMPYLGLPYREFLNLRVSSLDSKAALYGAAFI
ncbi:MAG: ROK family protein [Synergistaceae bacterium]|jgi:glucokinase|nr:ROK family protein [Synergistaceae bacterium]